MNDTNSTVVPPPRAAFAYLSPSKSDTTTADVHVDVDVDVDVDDAPTTVRQSPTSSVKFSVGDHVYCRSYLALVQHHAIVVYVDADFTIIADFNFREQDDNVLYHPIPTAELRQWGSVWYGAGYLSPCYRMPGTATTVKSDHARLVLARAQFVLSYPERLPPWHPRTANAECVAVWCKTGAWATLRTSTGLHLAATTPVKTAAVACSYVAAQTVAVPSAGVWGLLGYSTQVSLAATQPLLLPAIVTTGLLGAALPLCLLHTYERAWRQATNQLNTHFWRSFWHGTNEQIRRHVCSFLFPEDDNDDNDKKEEVAADTASVAS